MTGPTPRPEILTISPYVGGESSIPGVNRSYKLSSNEGAFGVPPLAQKALREVASETYRYPDGGADGLRAAIGKRWGLDPERIVAAPGRTICCISCASSYGGPGPRHHHVRARLHDLLHRRDVRGQPCDQGAGTQPDPDLDAMLAAVSPATQGGVPGQSEQPDRLDDRRPRRWPASAPRCRRKCCW